LAVVIPLVALIMVVGIGIPIGLLFIQTHNSFNENVTLIIAVALTAGIMAIAALLSYQDYKNPRSPEPTRPRPSQSPRSASQAGPRAPVTERPARGRSRSDGRRKSR
jgi:amino acid transporter